MCFQTFKYQPNAVLIGIILNQLMKTRYGWCDPDNVAANCGGGEERALFISPSGQFWQFTQFWPTWPDNRI